MNINYFPCEYYCALLTHPLLLPFFVRHELLQLDEEELYAWLNNDDIVTLHLPIDQFFGLVKERRLSGIWQEVENVQGGDMTELEDQNIPYSSRIIAAEINFEGMFYKLLPDGGCDEVAPPHPLYCDDSVFTIPLDRHKPSLFQRSYRDMSEIVEEIKEKLAKLVELPADFPYEEVIGLLSGTTWVDD